MSKALALDIDDLRCHINTLQFCGLSVHIVRTTSSTPEEPRALYFHWGAISFYLSPSVPEHREVLTREPMRDRAGIMSYTLVRFLI